MPKPVYANINVRTPKGVKQRKRFGLARRIFHRTTQIVFPMLFGHMAFVSHRCWTVYLRRAQFLAQESWRLAYGQLAIQQGLGDVVCEVLYQLPSGDSIVLKGVAS